MTTTIYVVATGASSQAKPGDWTSTNTCDAVGGGGGGSGGTVSVNQASGGGGGAFARSTNVNATGATFYFSAGIAGTAGAVDGNGGDGGDSWFRFDGTNSAPTLTSQGILAKGGGGAHTVTIGAGGLASASLGTTKTSSGGDGGAAQNTTYGGAGGGGAGGPQGNGGPGGTDGTKNNGGSGGGGSGGGGSGTVGGTGSIEATNGDGGAGGNNAAGTGVVGSAGTAGSTPGAAGNGTLGAGGGGAGASTSTNAGTKGGNGGPGQDWDSTHGVGGGGGGGGSSFTGGGGAVGGTGGLYGGGGGAGGSASTSGPGIGGAAGQGIIVLIYTPGGNALPNATPVATGSPSLGTPLLITPPPLILGTNPIDSGLSAFALANQILVCSQTPNTYADANTYTIGAMNFGIGNCFAAPAAGTSGRKVVSTAITTGSVTANGTPVCWAVIDDANSRLLAVGPMTGYTAVTIGQSFTLASFEINLPRALT
jgi:hypothetical protein